MGSPNVVIIQPHNDDAVIATGGALLKFKKAGWKIQYIYLTDGRLGGDDVTPPEQVQALRAAEAASERQRLGVTDYLELGLADQSLMQLSPAELEVAQQTVGAYLERLAPAVVFLSSPNDQHPDHQAAHDIFFPVVQGLQLPPCIFKYSVWLLPDYYAKRSDPAPQVVLVGIDQEISEKTALIGCHHSQLLRRAYDQIALHLSAYYALITHADEEIASHHGEVFGVYPPDDNLLAPQSILDVLQPVMDITQIVHGSNIDATLDAASQTLDRGS